jgi:DNA-binding NtrC family response regulator
MSYFEKDATNLPVDGLLSDLNVLIIEDENIVALELQDLLSDFGTRSISICASIAEARKQLLTELFDVIVLDLKLTDGSGLTLIPLIQSLALPIVITSGYPVMEIDQIPYVHKPYTIRTLVGALSSAIYGNQR